MRSNSSRAEQGTRREAVEPARRTPDPDPGSALSWLSGAQKLIGNRAVCALLGAQAKLDVSSVDDPLEREADDVATRVVQALRAGADTQPEDPLGGVMSEEPQLARRIQRRAAGRTPPVGPDGGAVPVDVERTLAEAKGGGKPLDDTVRQRMEGAFGADFGRVRVHTGPTVSRLNERLGATAFTVGNDIFFRSGLPDSSAPDGQHLLAHELTHTVQQGGGASSSASRVMRDVEDEGKATESEGEEGGAVEAKDPGTNEVSGETETEEAEGETEEAASEFEGTLSPIDEALVSTAPPPGMVADRASVGSARGRHRQVRAPAQPAGTHYLSVADINIVDSESQTSAPVAQAQEDKVSPSVKVTSSTAGGLGVTPFGAMGPDVGFDDQKYSVKVKRGKAGKDGAPGAVKDATVKVAFTLRFDCKWGTTNGGRTDVPSAGSPVVTADNYEKIVSDLTPSLIEKSWRAPRETYWSEAICARHEKYHATDARNWAKSQGKKLVVKHLEKQKVTLTDAQRDKPELVEAEMQSIMTEAWNLFVQAYSTYMNGTGLTYLSYPSEERAFGDGKKPYLALAADVKKKGKALAKAKAGA